MFRNTDLPFELSQVFSLGLVSAIATETLEGIFPNTIGLNAFTPAVFFLGGDGGDLSFLYLLSILCSKISRAIVDMGDLASADNSASISL